jgi:glutamine amidotransferase-like uncharacterized protein
MLVSMKRISFLLLALFVPALIFAEDQAIRVAVFKGEGVDPSYKQLIESLEQEKKTFQVSRITTAEILEGKLANIDVIVHPGGSGGGQGRNLGEKGREEVRKFVREGGGYLGVCAGAYLATNDYSWSLNLIDAKVVDRKHWARGKGDVEVQLSPEGAKLFQSKGEKMTIYYGQGPLLGRREWDDPNIPDYESLAIYASEIAEKGAPQGVMIGTSAAVRCQYVDGRVFVFSPHPEMTEGKERLIPIVVRWAAGVRNKE